MRIGMWCTRRQNPVRYWIWSAFGPLSRPPGGTPKTCSAFYFGLVGLTGFEPATSWSRTKHTTHAKAEPKAVAYPDGYMTMYPSGYAITSCVSMHISNVMQH